MERGLSYVEAITEALREEMKRDPRVFIMGIDVTEKKPVVPLVQEFGSDRFVTCPIAENGFVGAAVGAAIMGRRPVCELEFGDFVLTAMDSIANQAAKYRYMCGGGKFTVPLVIRATNCGTGKGTGPHHSQCVEACLLPIPGLKLALPSTPEDVKGILATALRDPNPVVIFEHKLLYAVRGPVPEGRYETPLGVGVIRRYGRDVTAVAFSWMVHRTLEAASILEAEGIDVEVIDPRTIRPLDGELIVSSVRKTGCLVTVEEGPVTGGIGAEVAAVIAEAAPSYLRAPVRRIGSPDAVIPGTAANEKLVVPSVADIAEGIRTMVKAKR